MRNGLLELEPCLSGRIHVIPSGYRTPAAAPVIRPEKKTLIDSASRPRMIYVSLFAKHKNHVNLIAALPEIVKSVPGATLMLTIEKDVRSNRVATQLFQRIRETVTQLGVENKVIWLGHLLPTEVEYALANSELLVFPSLAESFGLGLVEAMAAGCPIAAADLPYAHDVAGPAAHYFNPNSPESIAAAVIDVMSDTGNTERLLREGQLRKVRFQYENIAQQFAQVVEEAMANPFSCQQRPEHA
jgi:glycosyltransferase involved in cell wall biosynthesis